MIEATATCLTLSWPSPVANGEAISSYNLELLTSPTKGSHEGTVVASTTTATERKTTLTGLRPDTEYWARVRAVNCMGAGAWTPAANLFAVSTRPLPPAPPRCVCLNANHNSLKLKWGDGTGPAGARTAAAAAAAAAAELCHYTLEMENSRNQ